MGAECASSAHREIDCGNKEATKLKRNGKWPKVHLDIFPGMGLGLRATLPIAKGSIIGPYYGRAKEMPKRRSRRGHHYLVEMDNGIILDASREGSLMRYVNTSCNPNASLVQRAIRGRDELFYERRGTEYVDVGNPVAGGPSATMLMPSQPGEEGSSQDRGAARGGRGGRREEGKSTDRLVEDPESVSTMTTAEVQQRREQGWGGDDDMEWLETAEEKEERTIIDLLEKEEVDAGGEGSGWEDVDETINLVPSSSSKVPLSVENDSQTRQQKRQSRKAGKWIRTSAGKGRDSFKWVAMETEFDKKATKILQRFW
eukprot:318488-Rhodomonas_salina.1